MQIVLLVDDSGPGIRDVREGVAGFIRIVQRTAEIAIISTAKQNTVLVDFTSDPGALINAVNRLTTRTTTGGYQLEAIRESALTLMRRSAGRPVIVVLALEGKEYSSLSSKTVLDDVRRSGALVHVISVGKPSMKTMTSWNQRPTDSIHEALDETITRNTVFAEAPRRSGGRLEQVGQPSGIPSRLADGCLRAPRSARGDVWTATVVQAGGEDRGGREAAGNEGAGAEAGIVGRGRRCRGGSSPKPVSLAISAYNCPPPGSRRQPDAFRSLARKTLP